MEENIHDTPPPSGCGCLIIGSVGFATGVYGAWKGIEYLIDKF